MRLALQIAKNVLAIDRRRIQSARMGEQFLRLTSYCGVGLTCFAIGLAILVGLHELAGVNYLIAYVASFVITNITGYILNARFTFSMRSVHHAGAIRYMTVNAILLGVNTTSLKLLVALVHMWYLSAAVLLAVVNMPISFIGQWLFTYRRDSRSRTAAV